MESLLKRTWSAWAGAERAVDSLALVKLYADEGGAPEAARSWTGAVV